MVDVQLEEFVRNPQKYLDEVVSSNTPLVILHDYDEPLVVISKAD